MSKTLPIIIAGAGIGGLTLALALARQNRPVIVLERRTSIEDVGAGIQISPNASHVLIKLGVGAALMRAAGEPSHLTVHHGRSGADLASAPLGTTMRERYGAPYLAVHRADLQTVLLDAVRSTPSVKLLFGRNFTGFSEHGDSITVATQTANTAEQFEGAALVGADGLWSKVATAMGDRSEPEFNGHVAWRGLVPRMMLPRDIDGTGTGLWLGPKAHVVHYPVRNGKFINVVAVVADKTAEPGWSRHGDASTCERIFSNWCKPLRGLLSTVDEWQVWSLFDRSPRKRWSHGRVTLLGDAAHPVLPFLAQGGALAIEDAAVLASHLSGTPDDSAGAFKRYEHDRKPRTARVQAAARENGRTYHMGLPLSLARDLVIRRAGENLTVRYDWIYDWKVTQA